MLKQSKHNEIEILSVEDYIELFGKPNDTFGEQDQLLLYRLIKQATTQFDSLISPQGEIGGIYRFWNSLKDNDEDNDKGFRLQKAIGSWVETMVQNGKFWTDGVPNMSSNIDYDLHSSSKNSNIELKRKDIIQDLTAIGLTITTNLGTNNNKDCNVNQQEIDDFVLLSKSWVIDTCIPRDSQQYNKDVISAIDMNSNDLQNCGNIWNPSTTNKKRLTNFKLIGCEALIEDNNNIEVLKAQQADKILDPKDGVYKLISQFDVNYFGGLTEQEIYDAIIAGGSVWRPDITYSTGFVCLFLYEGNARTNETYKFAKSKIDNNLGNNPNNSPDAWEILDINPVDINILKEYIKDYVDNTIVPELKNETIPNEIAKQLNELPTIENIIFHKNVWYGFTNYIDFQNICTKYGINQQQYETMEVGRYIVSGDYGSFGGSNDFSLSYTLKQSDLPDVQYRTYHYNQYLPQYNAWITEVLNGDANSISYQRLNDNLRGNGNTGGGTSTSSAAWYTYKLNGGVSQTPIVLNGSITPKYQQVLFVKFKIDIVQRGVVVQETGATYTGQAPVVVDNDNSIISLEQDFVDKVNNFDDSNYAKLNQVNTFTQKQIAPEIIVGDENGKKIIFSKFEWEGNQYSALKIQDGSRNFIQFETNYTQNTSTISCPNGNMYFETTTLPTLNKHLTNKQYVDSLFEPTSQTLAQVQQQLQTNTTNIQTNTSDIANIKTEQTTQNQQIQANRDLSNQIITGLETLRVFNYIGTWNSTTTYKRNEAVDYNNRLFLSKADNNLNHTPPNNNQSNTYWLLINSIQATVDLSNYYTKIEIDNKLQDYLLVSTYLENMNQLQTRLTDLENNKANTSDLANYLLVSKFESMFQQETGDLGRVILQKDFNANNKYIYNVIDPESPQDCANKRYVDAKQSKYNISNGSSFATGNVVNGRNEYIYYWEGDVSAFQTDFYLPNINNCYAFLDGSVSRPQGSGTWITFGLRDTDNGVQTNIKPDNRVAMYISSIGSGVSGLNSRSIRVFIKYLGTN